MLHKELSQNENFATALFMIRSKKKAEGINEMLITSTNSIRAHRKTACSEGLIFTFDEN
jgi:hypothetical protein